MDIHCQARNKLSEEKADACTNRCDEIASKGRHDELMMMNMATPVSAAVGLSLSLLVWPPAVVTVTDGRTHARTRTHAPNPSLVRRTS